MMKRRERERVSERGGRKDVRYKMTRNTERERESWIRDRKEPDNK